MECIYLNMYKNNVGMIGLGSWGKNIYRNLETFNVLKKIDLSKSDALFVSCTALPVLSLINDLEKELNKPVISSNQALIWDCLELINSNYNIEGFGRLFKN